MQKNMKEGYRGRKIADNAVVGTLEKSRYFKDRHGEYLGSNRRDLFRNLVRRGDDQ